MIGQIISHYKILEKLGEGGMGVVYKAEDTKLKRTVALKFLAPHLVANEQVKKRFLHEAQAAAGLSHPYICTIHEIREVDGHNFMVMEYIEGESLGEKIASGPLLIEEALDIAVKVARGLAKAHGEGIIHRDIKPSNILITPEGQAKVVDFGLAKLATQTRITRTGMAVGTVAYMSPEQAQGQEVDHRTDIWSMGAMLYEMLTGRLPFRGEMEHAVLYSILNEEPEPVTTVRGDVPVAIEDIIEKALSKDPAKRYEKTDELLAELETQRDQITLGIKERRFVRMRWLRRGRRLVYGSAIVVALAAAVIATQLFHKESMEIDSIAVLPLENLMGDPKQEYFVDGMTDALITELYKIRALDVISRTSVMQYKGARKPLPEIARELDVDAVVEGTVLREGNRVRIMVQLIHASTDKHLWADQYDRELRGVLALHSEVAKAIAHEIQVTLTPEEQTRLTSAHTVNPEAHELYLRAKYHYFKYTKEELEKADEYFEQAIELDPNYAQAYAGLAASIEFQAWAGYRKPLDEAKAKIETLVRKALEIDNTIAETHLALSGKRFYLDWDWLGGEEEMKRAIELNPGLSESHYEYAHYLAAMGRFEESIAEAKRSLQLDPVSYLTNATLAFMYYFARQYDQSIEQYLQTIELAPNNVSVYRGLTRTYEAMGRYEDAVRAQQKAMTLVGNLEGDALEKVEAEVAALDSAYSESGPEGYWMWHLESMKGQYNGNPTSAATYYAHLGDKDRALAWLERAYEEHNGRLYLLKVNPSYDPLRDDPRFQDLLRRLNFPENKTQ